LKMIPMAPLPGIFLRYRLEETGNPLRSSGTEKALLPEKLASSYIWR
jgi:hypothetical protein